MKKTFLILAILFLTLSCNRSDDNDLPVTPVQNKCTPTIIDAEVYRKSKTDPFDLIAVSEENDCLKVTINYGGGCKDVSLKLITAGGIIKTGIGQRDLKIILDDDDDCKASITKDFYFDISNLKLKDTNKIQLNFYGTDFKYIYNY